MRSVTNNRKFLLGALICIIATFVTSTADARCLTATCDFRVVCDILDADTLVKKNNFTAGDSVLLRANVRIRRRIIKSSGHLTVTLTGEVSGFDFFIEILDGMIDVADFQERQQLEVVQDIEGTHPGKIIQVFEHTLLLPENLPEMAGDFLADLTIDGHGTFRCKKSVHIFPL